MKLGSHNTMTYLKPQKWYLYPFRFIARCQSKNIEKQYGAGARWFDLRIAFKGNTPYFKHGLMDYKGNVYKILEYLNTKEDVIVRILLEDDTNGEIYSNFCSTIEDIYTNIKFVGGHRKSDWTQIYHFKRKVSYTMEEWYASMPSNPKWYGIYPRLYSLLKGRKNTDADYLLIDFV